MKAMSMCLSFQCVIPKRVGKLLRTRFDSEEKSSEDKYIWEKAKKENRMLLEMRF